MVLRKSFYILWSAGRSPRVHEVNPGRDPSYTPQTVLGFQGKALLFLFFFFLLFLFLFFYFSFSFFFLRKCIGLLSTWVLNLLKAVNETRVGYAK